MAFDALLDDRLSTPAQQICSDLSTSRETSLSPKAALSVSASPLSKSVRGKRSLHLNMATQSEVASIRRASVSPIPPWQVSEKHGQSPNALKPKMSSLFSSTSPGPFHNAAPETHPDRPLFSNVPTKAAPPAISLAPHRRQSRFDPMGRDDDVEEDGYGELGFRHPLRRVAEEDSKEEGIVSLPGIKALFGVAGEHPPTPASASMYPSSSLPSLVANSPSSSPQTARTSRYSSLTSQVSSTSDTFLYGHGGWWAPDFEHTPTSASGSPRHPGAHRANSLPSVQPYVDQHADKRRRSDGPPALRDAEESARLRWQAQSRNASYPTTGNSPATTPQGTGLRSLLHPPAASSAMSRGSFSASSGYNSALPPFHKHPGNDRPFERRIAPVPSRSASLVGGQLAQSFADLSASDRGTRSPSAYTGMAPPSMPDRRPSALHHLNTEGLSSRASLPTLLSRPPSTAPLSRSASMDPLQDGLRSHSVTRPASPNVSPAPPRRSSLTEAIMAKSGDGAVMALGRYGPSTTPQSALLEKPSLSAPTSASMPIITGWPVRRTSTDSAASNRAISLNSDSDAKTPTQRGTKRGAREEEDQDMAGDPGMRGMEVLAESARRVQEAERDNDGSDVSPPRGQTASDGSLQGSILMGQGGAGPKYACAFCPKTFSRPSSLRIHTYSHTGERPFVCKEPSCRRRFSVQSNLKRHAKVHQMGAQSGATSIGQLGHPNSHNASVRPIERSHRHPIPPHAIAGGFYQPHYPASHPPSGQPVPTFAHYPPPGYDQKEAEGRAQPPTKGSERDHQASRDEGWEDEEDELEEDELDDEQDEPEK